MKFLCDENLPKVLITYLKTIHQAQVKSIASQKLFGLSDEQIATRSVQDKSIIVTFDKDFLAINQPLMKIIYLRFPRTDPREVIPYLQTAIQLVPDASKKKGGFVIYTSKHAITVEPLSSPPSP